MPYSPTLSAETSTPSRLLTTLQNWELSASSAEKPMLMVELTYTLLLNSTNGSEEDLPTSLMLEDITRMSCMLTKHLRRVSTMRSKMVTLSREVSSDHAEMEFLELAINGARLQWLGVEKSFFNYVCSMIHEVWCVRSPRSANMPIGSTKWLQSRIDTTLPISAYRSAYQDYRRGYLKTCEAVKLEVSHFFLAAPVARAPYGTESGMAGGDSPHRAPHRGPHPDGSMPLH